MYTTSAFVSFSACDMSVTKRLGIIDVYNDPGPNRTISASIMLSMDSFNGKSSLGDVNTRLILPPFFLFKNVMFDSPSIVDPSSNSANNLTLSKVIGSTFPVIASTLLISFIASLKSPHISFIAAINKFPKL